MPITVPGDPVENAKYLARADEAAREFKRNQKRQRIRAAEWRREYDRKYYASNADQRAKKRERERNKYTSDIVSLARKRLRNQKDSHSRYQWAIKWELALPRLLAKIIAERG